MKKMFRLTAVLAAAALAAGLMVGCSTVPSYGDSTTVAPTDTVLLLEQGEAVPALTNPEDFTENINTAFGGSAARMVSRRYTGRSSSTLRKTTRYSRKRQTTS